MRLGPSLIGAIVGGVVGVAAQIGLESSMGKEASWFAIVIGVLTGLGARAMAGEAIRTTSYARAGLAAIIGLAAIVGGTYAASEVVRKKNIDAYESAPKVKPSQVEKADDGGQGDEGGDAAAGEEAATDEESTEAAGSDEEGTDADEATDAASDESGGEAASDEAEAPADDTNEAADTANRDEAAAAPADTKPKTAVDIALLENTKQAPGELPLSKWQFAFFAIGTFLAYELARGGGKSEHPPASTEA